MGSSGSATSEYTYDVFISHASENKDTIVQPLAEELESLGLDVWFDEFELMLGDSLREKIDQGLRSSQYGLVVLSPEFFQKEWTQYELNGLVSRQVREKRAILPLWYEIGKADILDHSPALADLYALKINESNIGEIAAKITNAVEGEPSNVAGGSIDITSEDNVDVEWWYEKYQEELDSSSLDELNKYFDQYESAIRDVITKYLQNQNGSDVFYNHQSLFALQAAVILEVRENNGLPSFKQLLERAGIEKYAAVRYLICKTLLSDNTRN